MYTYHARRGQLIGGRRAQLETETREGSPGDGAGQREEEHLSMYSLLNIE